MVNSQSKCNSSKEWHLVQEKGCNKREKRMKKGAKEGPKADNGEKEGIRNKPEERISQAKCKESSSYNEKEFVSNLGD